MNIKSRSSLMKKLVVIGMFSTLALSATYVNQLNKQDVRNLADSLTQASNIHRAAHSAAISKPGSPC